MGIVQIWFEMRLPRVEVNKIIRAMGVTLQQYNDNFIFSIFRDYVNKQIDGIIKQETPF